MKITNIEIPLIPFVDYKKHTRNKL